jgi:hypothetical protein
VSQFVCFNKLQVEATAYFNNPSCKTQCEERIKAQMMMLHDDGYDHVVAL